MLRLRSRHLLIALTLGLAAILGAYGLGGRGVGRSGAVDDADARQAMAEARAAYAGMAKLRGQVDELELRLRVLETASGYKTLDGALLPPVRDPFAHAPDTNAQDVDPRE